MNTKPHRTLAAIVCFLFLASLAFAQEKTKKLPIVLTESKSLTTQLLLDERTSIEVTGKAIFRITAYNSDDSLAGILTFMVSDNSKQQTLWEIKSIGKIGQIKRLQWVTDHHA